MAINNENPLISATIFYYDEQYPIELSEQVLAILEQYGMFPPHKIYAGKLTRNRFIKTNEYTRDLFVRGYREKDVFEIDMSSGDSRLVSEYWRFDWGLTYYKSSQLVGACRLKPWNIITIQSTHGRLQDKQISYEFMCCIKDLIRTVKPFYASIDNLRNKLRIMDERKYTHFHPERMQPVFWGNYFGKDYIDKVDLQNFHTLPLYNMDRINDGLFFTLSDHPLCFEDRGVETLRRQVEKCYL